MSLGRACIVFALAAAAAASSCARQGGSAALDGDPSTLPRLEAIIVQTPLPPGWRLSEGGEARVAIELQAGRAGAKDGPGELSAPAGKRWLVPALMLADPRFSMSADEARSHGLEPLDEVIPPQRAAAIDGFWPGQTGYPFEEDLRLAVRASKGELPSEISSWALEAAKRADEDAERPIALGATGDIQVGPREGSLLISGEEGKAAVLGQGLLPLLRSFDFLIGNLEGQISLRGEPNPRKRYLFRFPPGTAAALKSAGFGLLLLGNNHALDYGLDALRDTFGDFDGAGLPYVGAGLDAAAAASPKVVRIAGSNRGFAFLGFAAFPKENMGFSTEEAAAAKDRPGVNADEAGTVAAIRSAAAAGEVVVVLCHGGREYLDDPPEDVKERYRRFVDAGAALVIGSHPHVLQGVEARGSSLIAYSLGNFLFTGEREPPAGQRGALVSILMYRGIARGLRLYPLSVTYEGSYLNGDAAAAEGRFARLCAALSAAPQESPAASP